MTSYIPNRVLINAEGQDSFIIRLPRNRRVSLTLPLDFDDSDVDRITKYLKLIASGGKDNIRHAGPPEPNGRLP